MVCTTFLDTNEISNVVDPELSKLLNESEFIKTRYVVKERVVPHVERRWLIFEIETYRTIYDVYYRYEGAESSVVQQLTLSSNSRGGVLNYFSGILEGLRINALQD